MSFSTDGRTSFVRLMTYTSYTLIVTMMQLFAVLRGSLVHSGTWDLYCCWVHKSVCAATAMARALAVPLTLTSCSAPSHVGLRFAGLPQPLDAPTGLSYPKIYRKSVDTVLSEMGFLHRQEEDYQ